LLYRGQAIQQAEAYLIRLLPQDVMLNLRTKFKIARRRTTMDAVGIILLIHAGLNLPEQIKKIVEIFFG
jgi:hypothetical protein